MSRFSALAYAALGFRDEMNVAHFARTLPKHECMPYLQRSVENGFSMNHVHLLDFDGFMTSKRFLESDASDDYAIA